MSLDVGSHQQQVFGLLTAAFGAGLQREGVSQSVSKKFTKENEIMRLAGQGEYR